MDWQAETIEALGLGQKLPPTKDIKKDEEEVKDEIPKEVEKPTDEEFEGVDSEDEIPKGQESKYGL